MSDIHTPPAEATAPPAPEEKLYVQPAAPVLPPGHGRIDCSCGALIHWCGCDNQDPSHYQAVLTLHHGCPSCVATFGDLTAEDAQTQAQSIVPTLSAVDAHGLTESATLEVIPPADAPPVESFTVPATDAQAVAAADNQVVPSES